MHTMAIPTTHNRNKRAIRRDVENAQEREHRRKLKAGRSEKSKQPELQSE
jgi:hypothetical protein